MLRRLDDRGQLLFAQLFGGLDLNHQRLDAGARALDYAANLVRLARQRLGRGHGQHNLAGRCGLQIALVIGRSSFDDDIAGRDARGRFRAKAPLNRAAVWDLKYELGLGGDG
jgi:hypothetical protein